MLVLRALKLFQSPADHLDLHSFPTRRSSDLGAAPSGARLRAEWISELMAFRDRAAPRESARDRTKANRSAEHTSELQSPVHLVCRLLLEKKKIIHVGKISKDGLVASRIPAAG